MVAYKKDYKKYGSDDSSGRRGLYYTMSLTPNSAGLFLNITGKEISVQHISGEIIATWQLELLAKRLSEKMPSLLFISAHVEERDGVEYFHFYRGQLMSEPFQDLLSELFIAGNLLLDLRLHDKGSHTRNHGTGFRIFENKLPLLFKRIEDI